MNLKLAWLTFLCWPQHWLWMDTVENRGSVWNLSIWMVENCNSNERRHLPFGHSRVRAYKNLMDSWLGAYYCSICSWFGHNGVWAVGSCWMQTANSEMEVLMLLVAFKILSIGNTAGHSPHALDLIKEPYPQSRTSERARLALVWVCAGWLSFDKLQGVARRLWLGSLGGNQGSWDWRCMRA